MYNQRSAMYVYRIKVAYVVDQGIKNNYLNTKIMDEWKDREI